MFYKAVIAILETQDRPAAEEVLSRCGSVDIDPSCTPRYDYIIVTDCEYDALRILVNRLYGEVMT